MNSAWMRPDVDATAGAKTVRFRVFLLLVWAAAASTTLVVGYNVFPFSRRFHIFMQSNFFDYIQEVKQIFNVLKT